MTQDVCAGRAKIEKRCLARQTPMSVHLDDAVREIWEALCMKDSCVSLNEVRSLARDEGLSGTRTVSQLEVPDLFWRTEDVRDDRAAKRACTSV